MNHPWPPRGTPEQPGALILSPEAGPTTSAANKLTIVTGSGRSGTSTVAGTLKMLGLSIPQPEVKADSTNPRGFFEPRWVVDFHKRLLLEVGVATLDARPGAHAKTARIGSRPRVRNELRAWLEQATEPQLVVKDPRTFWLKDLWRETAESLGLETNFVTMLRHPTEVVGSRDTHYAQRLDPARRKARETGNLAGWVNVALVNELASRGEPRAFVHYEDLLADWRASLRRVVATLDLQVNADLDKAEPHPVDDFIDVTLHRVRVTWDDLDVPEPLRDLAENVWQSLSEIADPNADHSAASARMDEYRDEYDALHAYSLALVHDATAARVRAARAQTRRRVEDELGDAQRARPSLARRVARRGRSEWSKRRTP